MPQDGFVDVIDDNDEETNNFPETSFNANYSDRYADQRDEQVYTSLNNLNEQESLSESQLIRNIQAIEGGLTIEPSASSSLIISPSNDINICSFCNNTFDIGTFILCSKCNKNVHYSCNKPAVSSYYKKSPKNFKCQFCKTNN